MKDKFARIKRALGGMRKIPLGRIETCRECFSSHGFVFYAGRGGVGFRLYLCMGYSDNFLLTTYIGRDRESEELKHFKMVGVDTIDEAIAKADYLYGCIDKGACDCDGEDITCDYCEFLS